MNKKKNLFSLLTCSALACVVFSTASWAQQQTVPRSATSVADPSRVQEQILQRDLPSDVSPRIEVKDPILQQMPEGAEGINFVLSSVQFEDMSVYSEEEMARLYAGLRGQNVSLADIYRLSDKITQKYRNDGYILTQVVIPPQTIADGEVRFRVVEGFIDRVSVEGDVSDSSMELIRRYAGDIKSSGPLNSRQLERQLLLINDLPGIEARSVLAPSSTVTGAADLRIIVVRDHYDAYLAADNFGSRFLGPVQFTGAASFNSIMNMNEQVSTQLVYAPSFEGGLDPELIFGSISYLQPVWYKGTTIEARYAKTSTDPGSTLADFDVTGQSDFFSLKLEHPFLRSRSTNLYSFMQFDLRNVETSNDLEATREDRIRAFRFGGRLEWLDNLIGVGINAISAQVSKGLELFGSSESDSPSLSRPAGDPNFLKWEAEVQRLQRVTSNLNVLLAAQGQYSSDALLSSEEFGVGGFNYGRAYDPSEIIGDSGFAAKFELQWNEPYRLDFFEDYQLYGFFDVGRTFNEDPIANNQVTDTATSTGIGIRADFQANTQAEFAVALPLNRDIEANGDQDPRFYFNISRRF